MRDEQIHAVEAQYDQRKAELNAQLDTSRLTEASRRAELAALDEQVAQNRQLVDESGRKLSRLESVSDYVTADRIEQARAETHQARVVAAQSVNSCSRNSRRRRARKPSSRRSGPSWARGRIATYRPSASASKRTGRTRRFPRRRQGSSRFQGWCRAAR
jgi:hypothetical protein